MKSAINRLKQLLRRINRQYYAGAFLVGMLYAGVLICSAFNNKQPDPAAPAYNDFAGNEACASCHKEICESQSMTAHYHTSSPAAVKSIKGNFAPGKNHFVYNAFMQTQMDTLDGVAYQSAMINGEAYQTQRFDVTVGSGRKGQTYLYWNGNQLFQLPVSYFTPLDVWCNSPGYPPGVARFDRNISARCIECHGTYAKTVRVNDTAVFNKAQVIYGIQCERCHGAAAKHVGLTRRNIQKDTSGMFILHIGRLARQQKLDLCALCHSGVRSSTAPAFTYTVGDKLKRLLKKHHKYRLSADAGCAWQPVWTAGFEPVFPDVADGLLILPQHACDGAQQPAFIFAAVRHLPC